MRTIAAFCSWSGGKDAALALHLARSAGTDVRFLLSMMTEKGNRSRSHGLDRQLLRAQAAAIGVPIRFAAASWTDYEQTYRAAARRAHSEGCDGAVFGAIGGDEHRLWVEETCAATGLIPMLPLWNFRREAVLTALVDAGFECLFVAIREGALPRELLGTRLDPAVYAQLQVAGVDLAGEGGEYHTVVVDGPIFAEALHVQIGRTLLRDGVWFIDVRPKRIGEPGHPIEL